MFEKLKKWFQNEEAALHLTQTFEGIEARIKSLEDKIESLFSRQRPETYMPTRENVSTSIGEAVLVSIGPGVATAEVPSSDPPLSAPGAFPNEVTASAPADSQPASTDASPPKG